ncbi:MAG: two-component regulator propeller domain-containing protein [Luteolibacter sp.]
MKAHVVLKTLMILALLASAPRPAQAQERVPQKDLFFAHLATADGLSENRVFAILQDRQGFMWFATRDGLNRYDGNSFVVFKNNPDDPASLSSNFIVALLEDDQGYLWVGTYGGGVNRFDPITGRFTRYRHDPKNPNSLSGDMVKCIAQDHRGNLWFGGDTGLSRFDPATQTFTRYDTNSDGQSIAMVNAMIEDSHGDIWFVGDFGLHHLNLQTGQIARIPATSGGIDGATCLREDKAGNLWMLAYHPIFGLVKYDRQAQRFTSYPLGAGHIVNDTSNLLEDGENGFWVSSSLGLYYFDRQQERFTHRFQRDGDNPRSLNDNNVLSLYRDRAGLLWVGTINSGLNILDFQQEQFGCYRHDRTNPNSLSPGWVLALHQDPDGILWAGFPARTLDRLDRKTGQITHYVPDNKETSNRNVSLYFISGDAQGYLWLGGAGSGLDRFDKRTGQFKHYRNDPNDTNSLMTDFVLTAHEDRSGNLWVGQYGGLSRLDRATERFTHYQPDPSAPTAAINNVLVIYQDRSGALWLGTAGGMLSRFDPKTETFVNYKPDSSDPHRLSGGPVNAILEDQAGTLWIGTEDGLYRHDRKDGTFTRYTEHQGLPGSVVIAILEDQAGRLWLGTKNGLSRFDPKTQTFRNYDASDGLQSNDFSNGSCKPGLNGEMFFGGSGGFNAFFPEKIRDNPYVPPVVLTDFQLFNKPVAIGKNSPLKKAINVADQITLRYDQNVFRLRFAALSFAQPQKNRYTYKLEGFDQDWQSIDASDCSATYTRLAPGSYTFRVKASNNHGVWNEQGATIQITVIPPWWMTWWFRGAAIAALLGLAFAFYRWRMRTIKRRNLDLERQLIERKLAEETQRRLNRELRAISNCNQALLRAEDERTLLNEICRIVCNEAGYRMAWVGYAEHDDAKTVRPVAWAGVEDGYLTTAGIVWSDTECGHCPTGSAIQTGKTSQVWDFVTDPQAALWRQEAARRGYRCNIALPLKDETGTGFGAFTIYSAEPDAFPPDEVRLLEELAGDLAFGIMVLRGRIERKRAEEALRNSAKEIQDLYDHAPCGYHSLDKDGVFVRINDTELSWLGYTRQEIQGKVKFSDLLTPEGSERFRQEFPAFKERGFVRDMELDLIRKDGTVMQVLLNATAVRDAQGNFMMSRSAVHDITELKRAQKAAAEEQERLKFIFDFLNIGICLTRKKRDGSEIRMINDAHLRIAGIRREEDTPETWRRITHPDDRARQDALVRKAETGKITHYSLDKRYVWADGQIVWVIYSKGRRKLEDGGFEELTAIVDITDRKRAEEEIRKLNEELEQRVADRTAQLETAIKELESFSYSVSHDLRAPLRSIDGFSRALQVDYADKLDDEGKDFLQRVRAASQKMDHLIDDMLRLSRINRAELSWGEVDLSDMAAQICDELKRSEPQRQVELRIAPDCVVWGDAALLRIALENILSNAWKYTGKQPQARIEFGSTQNAEGRVFFVRDNGCGFDMQFVYKLFNVFQRLHGESEFPGTGIGLASVQRAIHRHGGKVWIEGRLNEGATFYFSLPPAT